MKHLYGIYFIVLVLLLAACGQSPTDQTTLSPQVFSTTAGDIGKSVAANSTGVYVIGHTNGSLDGPNLGDSDAFIRKYNASGAVVWKRQFGTGGFDRATDIAVDSTGNSYVLGDTYGALSVQLGNGDVFLRKYSPTGAVLWTKQFGTINDDYASDVALDSLGNVYVLNQDNTTTVSFSFTLRKFNSSGSLLLSKKVNGLSPIALAVDSAGNVVVLTLWNDLTNGTGLNIRVYKYTNAFVTIWTRNYQTIYSDFAYDIATSGTDIYFTMRNGLNTLLPNLGARLVKLNGDTRAVVWTRRLEATSSSNDTRPEAITTDSNGNIYVSGEVLEQEFANFTEAGGQDIVAFKYNISGTRLWVRQFGEGTNGTFQDDISEGIAVTNDSVFLTGYTLGNLLGIPKDAPFDVDAYLAKLNITNAATVWIDQ